MNRHAGRTPRHAGHQPDARSVSASDTPAARPSGTTAARRSGTRSAAKPEARLATLGPMARFAIVAAVLLAVAWTPLAAAENLGADQASRGEGSSESGPDTPATAWRLDGAATPSLGDGRLAASLAPVFDETAPLRDRLALAPDGTGARLAQTQTLCPVEEGQDPFAVIDAFVQSEMAAYGFPGAQIAIAMDGEVVHARGFGLKHRDRSDPVDAETQFRIGSVTKMMTAAGVMYQVDRGLDLSQPLQDFVPEFELADPNAAANITVWNLLTHSSGIPEIQTGRDVNGPQTPEALSEWAGSLGSVRSFAPPSSFWNYSNPNFSLAGLVAERASGQIYNQFMAEKIWGPAGMTSTTLLPDEVMARGNFTYGHGVDPATGEPVIYAPDAYDNWEFAPAGFAFATASDLVRFASLLMDGGGDVLSKSAVEYMQTPAIDLGTLPGNAYGYGIMIEPFNDLLLRHHAGNMLGWGAYVLWSPEHRFAVSTLNNGDGNLTASLVCALEAMTGEPLPSVPDYSTDPSEWQAYTGEYMIVDNLFRLLYGWDRWLHPAAVTLETVDMTPTLRLSVPGVPDFINPSVGFSRTLTQATLNTFYLDADLDGSPDPTWSASFIEGLDGEQEARWIRNRLWVGTRYTYAGPGLFMPSLSSGSPW